VSKLCFFGAIRVATTGLRSNAFRRTVIFGISEWKDPKMFTSLNLYLHRVLQEERAERAALISLGREARRAEKADRRRAEK